MPGPQPSATRVMVSPESLIGDTMTPAAADVARPAINAALNANLKIMLISKKTLLGASAPGGRLSLVKAKATELRRTNMACLHDGIVTIWLEAQMVYTQPLPAVRPETMSPDGSRENIRHSGVEKGPAPACTV